MARTKQKTMLKSALLASVLMVSTVGGALAGTDKATLGAFFCVINSCDLFQKQKYRPIRPVTDKQKNARIQRMLNDFGFEAGSIDGVLGRQSRTAIREYQRYMGYPETGKLSELERRTLTNAWRKYQGVGSSMYPKTVSAEGPRALLRIERDPNYAIKYGEEPKPPQNLLPTPLPKIPVTNSLRPEDSLALLCEGMDQITRSNGSKAQPGGFEDPDQALNEKFCEARGTSIALAQQAMSKYAVSEGEFGAICAAFKISFQSVLSNLPKGSVESVLKRADEVNTRLGKRDTQSTRVYGEICTGMGYRLDDPGMALAGALSLTAGGHDAYGELVGHHLRLGSGVEATPEMANAWYSKTAKTLEAGGEAAFNSSSTPDRIRLIQEAENLEEQPERVSEN